MLERIQHIRGVGPFVEFKVRDHHDLRIAPLTVIFAHNGRGKSTLADLLRALGTSDPSVFSARRRLGASGEPTASFRVLGKAVAFASGAWTGSASVQVFDERFVNDNIYSGFDVGTDHLRNLARLVIGAEGVVLAKKSDELAQLIQGLHIDQRKLGKEILPSIEGMEINAFCALDKVPGVDAAIEAAEKTLARVSAADTIRSTAAFAASGLRPLDIEKLEKFLATTVSTISGAARLRVEERVKTLGRGAEQWLAEGVRFGARPTCPFCTQPTDGMAVISEYEAYFGRDYADHRASVASARAKLDDLYGPQAQTKAIIAGNGQEALRGFWAKQMTGVPVEALPVEDLNTAWTEGYAALQRLLDAKRAAPLDPIPIDADSRKGLVAFAAAIQRVSDQLDALVKLNPLVDRLKKEAASGSVAAARSVLAGLRNAKIRHGVGLSAKCDRYQVLSREIKEKTDAKAVAKAALETHGETVFSKYAGRVNGYLALFDTGFRIDSLNGSFEAGKSGSRFSIVLTDVAGVPIEAGPRSASEPCVGSVLSAGDRFSLALAFFLAQFPEKEALGGRCVVFDDPISSLDDHRRGRTKEAICALVERGAQVIVLSHYPVFLAEVHAAAPCKDKNALRLERVGSSLELQVWAVDEENLETFHRLRGMLRRFADENVGDPDLVGMKICAFLEAYVRVIDPERLPPGKWLGEYVKAVHALAAAGTHPIAPKRLKSLDRLRDFCGPFRHDATSAGTPPSRHPDEVKGYVREALAWVSSDTDWS